MSESHANGVDIDITELSSANLPFVESLYAQWLRDPSAVDSKWQALFEREDGAMAQLGPSF